MNTCVYFVDVFNGRPLLLFQWCCVHDVHGSPPNYDEGDGSEEDNLSGEGEGEEGEVLNHESRVIYIVKLILKMTQVITSTQEIACLLTRDSSHDSNSSIHDFNLIGQKSE